MNSDCKFTYLLRENLQFLVFGVGLGLSKHQCMLLHTDHGLLDNSYSILFHNGNTKCLMYPFMTVHFSFPSCE